MQVEIRKAGSNAVLTILDIGEINAVPQPGLWLDWGSGPFLVLLRRHRYQLKQGHYQLSSIALEVTPQLKPADAQWWNGQWVIGDPKCQFNARSPLLRCAVLPEGPCGSCAHFQLFSDSRQ